MHFASYTAAAPNFAYTAAPPFLLQIQQSLDQTNRVRSPLYHSIYD